MPPIWLLARRLEGKVSTPACILLIVVFGAIGLGLSAYNHPLIGFVVLVVVESLCCALGLHQSRLYRAPRFSSKLASSTRLLDYSLFVIYYAGRGMIGAAITAAIASVLMNTGVDEGDETADAIVLSALAFSAALLEASDMYQGEFSYDLRVAALLPLLIATGLVAARLIYREATGV